MAEASSEATRTYGCRVRWPVLRWRRAGPGEAGGRPGCLPPGLPRVICRLVKAWHRQFGEVSTAGRTICFIAGLASCNITANAVRPKSRSHLRRRCRSSLFARRMATLLLGTAFAEADPMHSLDKGPRESGEVGELCQRSATQSNPGPRRQAQGGPCAQLQAMPARAIPLRHGVVDACAHSAKQRLPEPCSHGMNMRKHTCCRGAAYRGSQQRVDRRPLQQGQEVLPERGSPAGAVFTRTVEPLATHHRKACETPSPRPPEPPRPIQPLPSATSPCESRIWNMRAGVQTTSTQSL